MTRPLSRREWWALSFIGCALLIAFSLIWLAAPARAQEDEVVTLAAEVGLDPVALQGALNTTGAPLRTYLMHEGLLPPPPPSVAPALARVAECIIQRESRGYAGAVNPRSGASGLGQFLPGTWRTTPQGKAGYSVFDPVANRAAVIWMLSVGRGREFATIGGC